MPSSCRIPHNIFPLQRAIIRPRHCDASPPSPPPPLHHDVLCRGCPRHDSGYGREVFGPLANESICIIFRGGNFRDAHHDAEDIIYSMASDDGKCTTLVQRFPLFPLTIYIRWSLVPSNPPASPPRSAHSSPSRPRWPTTFERSTRIWMDGRYVATRVVYAERPPLLLRAVLPSRRGRRRR